MIKTSSLTSYLKHTVPDLLILVGMYLIGAQLLLRSESIFFHTIFIGITVLSAFSFSLLQRQRDKLVAVLLVLLLVFLGGSLFLSASVSRSVGWWLNRWNNMRFLTTGAYQPPYADAAGPYLCGIPACILVCALLVLLQSLKRAWIPFLLGEGYLLLLLTGQEVSFPGSLFFLTGILLSILVMEDVPLRAFTAGAAVLVVCTICFPVLGGLISGNGIADTGENDRRGGLDRWLHKLRYEGSTMAMPEGDLQDLPAWTPDGSEAMLIRVDSFHPMYLPGFHGAVYRDSQWMEADREKLLLEQTDSPWKSDAQLLYQLGEDGFYPGNQLALAYESLQHPDALYLGEEETELTELSMEYRNVCRRWLYLPYGSTYGSTYGRNYDSNYESKHGSNYESDSENILTPDSITRDGSPESYPQGSQLSLKTIAPDQAYYLMSELLTEYHDLEKKSSEDLDEEEQKLLSYLKAESWYRDYVYRNYLDVPEEVRKLLVDHGLAGQEGITTTQARKEISAALNEVLTYEENLVTSNWSMDFLEYVLDISKKGYSVHYASLAAMMFRTYGIPSRYVEGYLIPKRQIEALQSNTDYLDSESKQSGGTLLLTQNNSHAWVEFYLDGVGWIPYDPTPAHRDEIVYELPPGIGEAEFTGASMGIFDSSEQEEEEEQQDLNLEQQETRETDNPGIRLTSLLALLLLLILILLLGMTIRYLRKRRLLLAERTCMKTADPKIGSLMAIKALNQLLLRRIGGTEEELYDQNSDRAGEYLQLSREELEELRRVQNRIWLSDHEVTEESRTKMIDLLETAEASDRDLTRWTTRLAEKYISCIKL